MASKISGQTMYLPIAPYKVDGCEDEFNELSVTVNYGDRRKHFYVAIHAGWKSSYGIHGCINMGGDDPLTAPKYVAVKDSPKNSRKTIEQMFANLELAKDGIAWLFDRRDWTRLYAAVKNIALYGYTEQFRGQMEGLMKSPTPDPSPTGAGSGCADEEPEAQTDGVRYRTATMAEIEGRDVDLYMNGERVWVMMIHRSETIGEDDAKLDYIMLTNMKKVQVEDLQVIDDTPEESPMMKQWRELKAKHPEALLLFRCGDFYEAYGEDAKECATILGITLTWRTPSKRHAPGDYSDAMAGFPHHALDTYLPKLIRAGKRIAFCDQLEDPKLTKRLVKRGITELVSPATNNNSNNIQNSEDKTMKLNLSNKNNESANVQNNAQVNNAAIKREQSGAGSGYAEREQGRPQGNANEPIVRQVDVMGLMGALNRDGHARLSDHVIEDADAEEVKDEQEEEIQSVAVGEVTLASIMPVMQPIEGSEYGVKDDSGKEVKFESVAPAAPAPTKPAVNTGRTRIVVAGVPKPGESGDKPNKPVTLKKKQTEPQSPEASPTMPQSPEAPRADTGSAPTLAKARYFVQLLEAKSGGLWPKLYGFKDEKSAKAMAEKMPSSVNAKWDYGVNGEGRETKTRHWHLTAGKRYCDVMQELADALNKGDRVAVANAAAKACGVYAGVVAENTRIRKAMAA